MTNVEKKQTNISNINDFMGMNASALVVPEAKEIEVTVERIEEKVKHKETNNSKFYSKLPEEHRPRTWSFLKEVEEPKTAKKGKVVKTEEDYQNIPNDIKALNDSNAKSFTAEQFLYVLFKRNAKASGKVFVGNIVPATSEKEQSFENRYLFTNSFAEFMVKMNQFFKKENQYITPNFYTPKQGQDFNRRLDSNVRGLNTVFVDIDFLKAGKTYQETLNEVLDSKYIKPSAIVSTGNGLQVYYHLTDPLFLTEKNRKSALSFYKAVQKALTATFSEFGGDTAISFTNYMRLPDTINNKESIDNVVGYGGSKAVECVFLNENTYSLKEMSHCFDNGAYEQAMEAKEQKKKERLTKKQKSGRKSKNANGFTKATGEQARISDFFELVRLRKGHVKSRNDFLNQVIFYEPSQAKEINKLFANPEDMNKIESLIEYHQRKLQENSNLAKLSKWTNEALIERFEITEEEQKHLKHIIGKKEKARRKAIKRKKQRELPRRARELSKEIKIQIIRKSWKSKDKTNAEWAKILNVSESTFKKLKKEAGVAWGVRGMLDEEKLWEYEVNIASEIHELLELSPTIVNKSKKANVIKNIEGKYFTEYNKKDLIQLMTFFEKVGKLKVG